VGTDGMHVLNFIYVFMTVFLPSLKSHGFLDRIHMTICNVGSRKISEYDDYSSLGWDIFAPNLAIYGFDADADACNEANADIEARHVNWTEKHIPLALNKSIGEFPLYVTKSLWCTSLYSPNHPYLSRFAELSELMNLDFTVDIETTTLDAFCQSEGISEIDFLQIDVQGADLNVLEGATQLLKNSILAIQTEVEFSHLYLNQPLFADVDIFLRDNDFTLFNLSIARRIRSRSPIYAPPGGQMLWGDALYFRDLIREDRDLSLKTPERILKLACIADVMNFPDYAFELLEYLTQYHGSDPNYNFTNSIAESLAQIPEPTDII
jgi:FkbM family methyltransferase